MTCAERVCRGWPGWALRRTWQTKSSIISQARFQESRPYISGTISFRSVGKRSTCGELMLASFSGNYPMIAESI